MGGDNPRVLVIGARGALGALTARAFGEAGWTVRCGVRRPGPGQIEIDLGRSDLVAAALDEHELVVNTVPHPALLAERYVLERGGKLINISALPAAASRSLRATSGGARGTVITNAGLAPGVTTIVAAELLGLYPDAHELEIVFTVSFATSRGSASTDFIHRGLSAVARHRTRVVPLPRPFGERRCLGFGEGDAGWLGGIAEGRIVRQYICVAEPVIHNRLLELNTTGVMRSLRKSLVGPTEPAVQGVGSDEPVAHWIAAIRGGLRLGARTVECRGDFLRAARSTVVFADALLTHPRQAGCFDPEELFTLRGMEAKLRGAGVTIVPRIVREGCSYDHW